MSESAKKGREMLPAIIRLVTASARSAGIDPALALAITRVESGGNPNAVSPVGATGLMQLMPTTAITLGVPIDKVFDPTLNSLAGCRFMKTLIDRYHGDIRRALAAYNWGPHHVDDDLTWPTSVTKYADTVLAWRTHYQTVLTTIK